LDRSEPLKKLTTDCVEGLKTERQQDFIRHLDARSGEYG
jgi:hypothetical protein